MGIISFGKIAVLLAILAAAAAGYLYVTDLQEQNARLESEKALLQLAVTGLEKEKQQLEEVGQLVREEMAVFLKVDAAALADVTALRNELSKFGYRQKQQRVHSSREKARKHLYIVNRASSCQWLNFANLDGECQGSRFIKRDELAQVLP